MQFTRITALTLVALSAFAGSAFAQGSAIERIKKEGVIRIGSANEAPFTFTQADGSVAGADYELAKVVLDRLGLPKQEYVMVNFGALIPGLKARRFDIIAAALVVRPDRCAQVIFSEPHIAFGDTVIVKAGNPKNIHSLTDIAKDTTIKVNATVGALHYKNALAAGIAKEQIVESPNLTTSLAAVKAGRADGTLQNSIWARWFLKSQSDPAFEIATPFEQFMVNGKPNQDYASYAFNPEDTDLRDAFNTELAKVINTPAHKAILEKYGLTPAEVPQGITAQQRCNP